MKEYSYLTSVSLSIPNIKRYKYYLPYSVVVRIQLNDINKVLIWYLVREYVPNICLVIIMLILEPSATPAHSAHSRDPLEFSLKYFMTIQHL